MSQPAMYRTGTPLKVAFHDSYVPNLTAGTYTVRTGHVLDGHVLDSAAQEFTVAAPRFVVGDRLVEARFPAPGAGGDYQRVAPHLTLTRELLPWARPLAPEDANKQPPQPWFTLMLFREGELLRNDAVTVDVALTSDKGVSVPALGGADTAEAKRTVCRVIEVGAETFDRIAPLRDELPYLVHAREVTEKLHPHRLFLDSGEDLRAGRYAVAFANRLPRTDGSYSVHLVSLEGCAGHFSPKGRQPRLRLLSLHSWSFNQVSSGHAGFASRMRHLAAPGVADAEHGLSLRLPEPGNALPEDAARRLAEGYVPTGYLTSSGEETFGWYRGPFTSRRALDPPWGKDLLERPDAALIYLQDRGIYDLSYAAAWNLGRLLVLADANLSNPLARARSAAWQAMHLATAYGGLFAAHQRAPVDGRPARPPAGHELMDHLMDGGLGDELLSGLGLGQAPDAARADAAVQAPRRADRSAPQRPGPRKEALAAALRRGAAHPRTRHYVRRAVTHHVGAIAPATAGDGDVPPLDDEQRVAAHLDEWTLLTAAPFHYLVPDARLLPPESLRFFYVDAAWLRALVDGAVSVGVGTTLDSEVTEALREAVTNDPHALPCGMLMRSQLVADIPNLLVTAQTKEGKAVPGYRRDLRGGVLLLLFADVPSSITVAEPCHGLHFGLDEGDESDQDNNVIRLRRLKNGTGENQGIGRNLGADLKNVSRFFRPAAQGAVPDVLRLAEDPGAKAGDPGAGGLVAALTQELRAQGQFDREKAVLCPAEFALQCVNGPQQLTFRYQGSGKDA
ncbi:hypothetical protein [Streptomyces sp. NPDC059788]|uniref:hypothetical protein n=1 Tax=Streptomyces sp. NPDC059788 TaxID=3346948 RepID=UPI00364AE0CB